MPRPQTQRIASMVVGLTMAVTTAFVSAAQAVDTSIPARVTVVHPPVSEAVYPATDYGKKASAKDDRHARTTWRVVEETGNCCETFLTTTAGGRLLDFGGRYIHYSDDRGLTWRRVEPLAPLVNGEGAIVAAPGGDVLGVEWDPYTGDHLQSYKFEADTQQWLYTEMPLHQPFYDREWIAVVPGPVTVEGLTYPYVSFIKGGFPTKEVFFYSTDGLNYQAVTSKALEQLLTGAAVQAPLPVAANPDNDWVQPNTNTRLIGLGAGEALAGPDLSTDWALLDGDTFSWAAYTYADGSDPEGMLQVDSAGRVHNVIPASDGASFVYRISPDAGQTWNAITVALPAGHAIEEIDFRANLAAGVAAVATRAQASSGDQDLVFKLDITGSTPRVTRLHEVGLGDVDSTGGVGNDIRFDFESVTLFPDGRVAVSFMDSTTMGPTTAGNAQRIVPALAVELDTTLGGKVQPEPTVVPVMGEPYVTYTFDAGDEGWTSTDVPPWTRGQPGTKTGSDDPATASFGFEGPAQYVDNVESSLVSPPIATVAGLAVLEFWVRTDTEAGFDFLHAEWSSNGMTWSTLASYSGRNDAYPGWSKRTLGFDSPGGDVQIRFRFSADLLCSAVTGAACGIEVTGVRVDEVVVGRQA